MDKYVRLCQTVNTVGLLIPLAELESEEKLNSYLAKAPNADWYTSVYYYGKDGREYFDTHGKIKDYKGSAHTKKLLFDFDNDNLDLSRNAAVRLLEKLQQEGVDVVESCKVYFSGGKGFHVEVYTNNEFAPEELKSICTNIVMSIDPILVKSSPKTKVFDTTVYNITRLIRLVNTKHQGTGLFKIEIEPDDLVNLTIDQIKDLAKEPKASTFTPKPVGDIIFLNKYKTNKPVHQSVVVSSQETAEGIRGLDSVDFSKCPAHVPRCIYALSKGIMMPGERSRVFFRLAAYYRNQGLDKDVTYNLLKGIARLNANLYPEAEAIDKNELWNQHIASAYSSSAEVKPGGYGSTADNELVKHYCEAAGKFTDRKCTLHGRQQHSITQISDVSNSFQSFAENFKRNSVQTGIGFIDKYMNITVGTTTLLVGACGSGKTTVALNIMENANALGQHTMFFSLDMHKNLVYLKLAQKLTNYTQKEILEFYENRNTAKIKEIKDAISKAYDKTFFDFTSSMSIEEMRDKVYQAEAQHNCKIKLVVVDYASRIAGQYSDSYANARYNALRSTEISSDTDAAWIYISQISRNTGDGSTPLRTKRAAKESGDWEESATNVITVWRPYMGCSGDDPLTKDNVLRMFLAKNRMGKEVEKALWWDGATGRVWDMEPEEEETYKNIDKREEKEQEILKSRFKKV